MAALAWAARRGRAAAPCLHGPCAPWECQAPDVGEFSPIPPCSPWRLGWQWEGLRVLMWQRAERCPRAPGDGRRASWGGDSLHGWLPWTPPVG